MGIGVSGVRRQIAPDGGKLALALVLLILAYQVLIPLLMVLWTSFKIERPGEAGFFDLSFSLDNYVRAFGSKSFWQATWNTLCFASASTGLAFGLGGIGAALVGQLADITGIELVFKLCSFLPALGLLAAFLPQTAAADRPRT